MRQLKLTFGAVLMLLFAVACNRIDIPKSENQTLSEADTLDATNDFYDNAKTYNLALHDLVVEGEIVNPGKVDFSDLPLHQVIVKETVLDGNSDRFVGAYKYEGYSLYDLLNTRHLNKKNAASFNPIIDLFVEIENAEGEKAVISWGEIYYPNHLHEIMIATKVTRIVPSKTNELWELPTNSRLILSSDLITERNISNPTKITVKSYPIELKVEKGKNPLFSSKLDFYMEQKKMLSLLENPTDIQEKSLHTVFYGRGRGIHSTQPFSGISLKDYFADKIERNQKAIREGIFVIAADDGYRAVFTYSELCNRNDQAEVLLICNPELNNDGIFRVFPSCDFFSDRAIKGINAIYYSENQN
ncbi:MAG: hypothetical protein JW729_04165 [Bacteroidales bacterium]|nr:hypothetical protein [Bacteroidales bacterium]